MSSAALNADYWIALRPSHQSSRWPTRSRWLASAAPTWNARLPNRSLRREAEKKAAPSTFMAGKAAAPAP